MPAAPIGLGLATLIGSGVGAGTTLVTAKMQSSAAKRSGNQNADAARRSEDFLRQQDADDRAQYGLEYDETQGRKDLYRNFANASLADLSRVARGAPVVSKPAMASVPRPTSYSPRTLRNLSTGY